MSGWDWETIVAGLGTAIGAIREMASSKEKVEVIRERMGVVADRLELSKDQLSFLKDVLSREIAHSEKLALELSETRAENRALQLQVVALNQQVGPEKFAERHGLLFKRMADGAWSSNAHCPNCRTVLTKAFQQLHCTNCKWTMTHGASKIDQGLAELRAQDATPSKALSDYDPYKET